MGAGAQKSALFVQANVAVNTKITPKVPFLFGNFDVFKQREREERGINRVRQLLIWSGFTSDTLLGAGAQKSALFVQANVAVNTKITPKVPFFFGNFDVF